MTICDRSSRKAELSLIVSGEELLRAFVLRMTKYHVRGSLFSDSPIIHEDDLAGHITCKGHFMGDNNHGKVLLCQVPDDAQNLTGKLGIKGRGWLIKTEDIRGQGKCPGNGDPLLLST